MLDLCCGLKGASSAFAAGGWDIVTLDIDERFNPDIVADVTSCVLPGYGPGWFDLIWASFPCTEFSRESMPWCRTGAIPSMDIFLGCIRLIDALKPKFWILENTRGSIPYVSKYIGRPRLVKLPYVFWGFFPVPGKIDLSGVKLKSSYSSTQDELRSKIPFVVSSAFCSIISKQESFL